jgi:hypothetical protein
MHCKCCVLNDRMHIVITEGLVPHELNEKTKEANNGKQYENN